MRRRAGAERGESEKCPKRDGDVGAGVCAGVREAEAAMDRPNAGEVGDG